jgi:hypothetical protein
LALSVCSFTHALPHAACPLGQSQLPCSQLPPVGQVMPHLPQLVSSVCSSTHASLHIVSPLGQAQLPAWQTAPVGHSEFFVHVGPASFAL